MSIGTEVRFVTGSPDRLRKFSLASVATHRTEESNSNTMIGNSLKAQGKPSCSGTSCLSGARGVRLMRFFLTNRDLVQILVLHTQTISVTLDENNRMNRAASVDGRSHTHGI